MEKVIPVDHILDEGAIGGIIQTRDRRIDIIIIEKHFMPVEVIIIMVIIQITMIKDTLYQVHPIYKIMLHTINIHHNNNHNNTITPTFTTNNPIHIITIHTLILNTQIMKVLEMGK